jgi:hypothetical protein
VRVARGDRGAELDGEHEGGRHRQAEGGHVREIGGLGADRFGGMAIGRAIADAHDRHGRPP